jgi:hypothetical protein
MPEAKILENEDGLTRSTREPRDIDNVIDGHLRSSSPTGRNDQAEHSPACGKCVGSVPTPCGAPVLAPLGLGRPCAPSATRPFA